MGSEGQGAGVYHPLERGMTLYMLSKSYNVPLDTLMAANEIVDPTSIPAGTQIFVPGATEMLPLKPPVGRQGPVFSWPLRGRVTSPFGSTSKRKRHAGLDIDGDSGEEIRAAADGRVARIADNARYGLLVVVEHDGGYATWYGHASGLLVGKGDHVGRGQVIALVGKTGNAHGSHLHFEIRRNGAPVDPIAFLESRVASAQTRAE